VRGVWREFFGSEAEPAPPYGAHWAESGQASLLTDALNRNMRLMPQHTEAPGQVLLFAAGRGGPAKHLGIQTAMEPEAAFVHAYSGHGVVESALTRPWRRRLIARFAFPID
jgi:NlpC/P60 family putative phage cell wall peptidase